MRLTAALLACLLLAPSAWAGGETLRGGWKLVLQRQGQQIPFWLLTFAEKDGKLAATAAPLIADLPPTLVGDMKIDGDLVHFGLSLRKGPRFDFEGRLPRAGAKKVFGSLSTDGSVVPVVLERTAAKNLYELNRELITRAPNDPRAQSAIFELLEEAKNHKAAAKDVREWVESSLKAAAAYGPRWEVQHTLRLAEALQKESEYTPLAAEVAGKADKMLDAKASIEVLTRLAKVYRAAKQPDAAKKLEARIAQAVERAYVEHRKEGPGYKVAKYAGRKIKSDRRVLVELFTGAQCPPCVAADLAFDGLADSYGTGEVVLLQYHEHIPRPDALAGPATEGRFEFYAEAFPRAVRGTPVALFNGKPAAAGGGGRSEAPEKYREYIEVVNKLLEQPAAAVQLTARASRKGDKVSITANVKDLAKPGEKVKLRLVLVEDWAHYRGSNGLSYHHRVVRDMPGGVKGIALTKKDVEQSVTVDLNDLRKQLNKYLDDAIPPGAERPMRLRDLHVVAFVQDDATAEVLQAIDVPVRNE